MAELKFLKGRRENFSVASANSNYFYFVTNNDNTIDMYLGGVLLAKSADVADIQSLIKAIEVLNGDGEGSVKKAVADAIADVVANADEDFDTLKEIADYIVSDPYGSAELKNRVTSAETAISNAEGEIDALQAKMADVESKAHIHANMDLLNEISEDKVNSWDAAEQNAKDYADAEIAKISIPSVEGLASREWVEEQGYLTEHQSLAEYATQKWVEDKGYLTQHQSLDAYALKSELPSVEGLASREWVGQQGFLTVVPAEYVDETELASELASYALKSELPSVEGLASKEWVEEQGYLTEHQSLAEYAKKSEIPSYEGAADSNIEVTEGADGKQIINLVWGEF